MIKEIQGDEFKELGEDVQQELTDLVPENARQPIVVGDKKYWMYPPTYSEIKAMQGRLGDAWNKFGKGLSYAQIVDMIVDKLTPYVLKIIGIRDIDKLTPEQIVKIVYTYINMAIKFKRLNEDIRKNLTSLWGKVFKRPEANSSNPSSLGEMLESSFVSSTSSAPKSSATAGKSDVTKTGIIAEDAPKIAPSGNLS